ncbi:hypothetical protein ASPSYDRAFT_629348 [Aspergillus sydowii CBS 593.65]|uniref:Uncharacterized protein n=1 Tax=Aspergillus sydowii CBS 593.65 TaxID=1036612 RepID=A0A1L9TSG4_9EURO|nr:uncharacterized protein ASPSYDRAFT_629348 [Aspergillus sydowii CBS 593.65]OJJ62223.1 hypothetical protein ASPSYDRAFT_629348 [Aspergillus sydowii CBS 593.65]
MEAKGSGQSGQWALSVCACRATHCPSNRDLCSNFAHASHALQSERPNQTKNLTSQVLLFALQFGSTERFSVFRQGTTVVSYLSPRFALRLNLDPPSYRRILHGNQVPLLRWQKPEDRAS